MLHLICASSASSFILFLGLLTSVFANSSLTDSVQNINQSPGERYLPAVLDLGTFNATDGILLQGGGLSGWDISNAGDVNGDGISDWIIAAPASAPRNLARSGTNYVVFGNATMPSTINLNSLTADQGAIIQGIYAYETQILAPAASVSGAGDVNGDGFDDVIVGFQYADPLYRSNAGAAYILYGGKTLSGTIYLFSVGSTSSLGVLIPGPSANYDAAASVSGAGDVNGDGFDDVIIGAYNSDSNSGNTDGEVYIIYGGSNLPATIDLATFNATYGVVIKGTAYDNIGGTISGAGDINDDGFDDIIIGNDYNYSTNDIGVYILYGGSNLPATIDLASFSSTQGLTLTGVSGVKYGNCANVGDVNGDGIDDVIIVNGFAYVVYGSKTLPSTLNLPTMTAGQGIAIYRSIDSASSAGDVNNDGFSDIIFGVPHIGAGIAYIVYGAKSLPSPLYLYSLTAAEGVEILGVRQQDCAGWSVSSAGDVNKDGFGDVMVSAPYQNSGAGVTYIIYGGLPSN